MIDDEKIIEMFFERSEQGIRELDIKYGKACHNLSYHIVGSRHPQGTAEIEDGKKKIRQFENLEKRLRQKLSKEERRTRNNHLYNQEGT